MRIFGFSVTEVKRFFEFDITWPVPPSNPIESARRRGSFFLTHSFESRAERVRNRIYGIIFSSNDKDSLSLSPLLFLLSSTGSGKKRTCILDSRIKEIKPVLSSFPLFLTTESNRRLWKMDSE